MAWSSRQTIVLHITVLRCWLRGEQMSPMLQPGEGACQTSGDTHSDASRCERAQRSLDGLAQDSGLSKPWPGECAHFCFLQPLLDAQQLIVFDEPLRTARSAGLDLPGMQTHGEICDER